MCGICGYIGKEKKELLKRMGDTIYHRGPDAEGLWQKEQVNLCSRRLSIVDQEGGIQPAKNQSEEIVLVWNGEIYNAKELRRELEQKQVTFYSRNSDTEILLRLYENYGLSFLQKVNGMFAIAIWDRRVQKLYLIRDRMGVKPLYYSWNQKDFIFASEIKAIWQHPLAEKKICTESLYQYFSYHTVPGAATLYENIFEVPPATILAVDLSKGCVKKISSQCYWTLSFGTCEHEQSSLSLQTEKIEALLLDAVKIRMQADVEVGAFLSGGLDSSLVAAMMAQQATHTTDQIRTYALGYQDINALGKEEDVQFAAQLAEKLGSKHTLLRIGAKEFSTRLPQMEQCFDQPFSANLSPFFLTEQMGKEIKCALSGDGADELFGSYQGAQLAAAGQIPIGAETEQYVNLLNINDELKGFLLSEEMFGNLAKETYTKQSVADQVGRLTATDAVNRFLEYQWQTALVDQVLTYTDRLSMAHSLEVRSPFLDVHLVEYVASLPGHFKLFGGEPKYLLKKAAESFLPKELIYRKKEMFFPPVHEWMQKGMKISILETLSERNLKKNPYLNEKNIQYLLHRFYQNPAQNAKMGDVIWNLYCFQIWYQKFSS